MPPRRHRPLKKITTPHQLRSITKVRKQLFTPSPRSVASPQFSRQFSAVPRAETTEAGHTTITVNCNCSDKHGGGGGHGQKHCGGGGGDYAYHNRCACPVFDHYGYPYDPGFGYGGGGCGFGGGCYGGGTCGYRGYGGLPWPALAAPAYVPSPGPYLNPSVTVPPFSVPILYPQ